MTMIDLLDYSEASQKIPSSLLDNSPRNKEINPVKVVFAHYQDFTIVVALTLTIHAGLSFYFEGFLPSWNVKEVYQSQSSNFSYALFPIILLSYFFFSYLFNDGQSLGLYSNRLRIASKNKGLRSSLMNALRSSLICLTGGLSFFWSPSMKVASHDYLYRDLLEFKDQHISLRKLLKARRVVVQEVSEKLAA